MQTKCIVIGVALKVRGQKYDKLSLKIVQKALKRPLQFANFPNLSGGACPRTPLESLLLLKLLKIKPVEKNYARKVTKIGAPSLKKILNRPMT